MTTQEYVKKEASLKADTDNYDAYADGLSAGIELAKEFHKWSDDNGYRRYEVNGDTWYSLATPKNIITTSELFEIFLTERNG